MSKYTPAEHAHCHVCGHWARLTSQRLMYRHRYGGATGSDFCPGGRARVGEIIPGYAGPYVRDPRPDLDPRPIFTDTNAQARLKRIAALNTPAVSNPTRGESEKVVQRFPETNEQEAPLNFSVNAEPGKTKQHRAYVTVSDGTQGIFCESDDLATAVGQVTSLVTGSMTISELVGLVTPAPLKSPVLRTVASRPDEIKSLVRTAMRRGDYITLRRFNEYHTALEVCPLYELAGRSGFVGRQRDATGSIPRTFKWDKIHSVERTV